MRTRPLALFAVTLSVGLLAARAEAQDPKPGTRPLAIDRSACTDKGKKLYKASVKFLKSNDSTPADLVAREAIGPSSADLSVKLVDASKDKSVNPGGGLASTDCGVWVTNYSGPFSVPADQTIKIRIDNSQTTKPDLVIYYVTSFPGANRGDPTKTTSADPIP
jgi:hypothetical protein